MEAPSLQPGPGHRAGVDATQPLPDGREEGAVRSRSSRSRTTQWSHTVGRGQWWVRGEGGREGRGQQGVTGAAVHGRDGHWGSQRYNRGTELAEGDR